MKIARKLTKFAQTAKSTVKKVFKKILRIKSRWLKKRNLLILGVTGLAFFTISSVHQKNATDAISKSSVMVVRMDRRSGGSGVIIKSGPDESVILTNSHVCRVIQNGGLVITESEEHAVMTCKQSEAHDLCLITVAADLGINTPIARSAPKVYSDAAISGHPSLLPNIVTRGHFTGRRIIEVLVGFKECTQDDLESDNAIFCVLLGGVPQFKNYETQVVTATIMPGSSGSGVFDSRGEISTLVFAGSGELGYAMTVPYENISKFLRYEQYKLSESLPRNGTNNQIEDQARLKLQIICTLPQAKAVPPISHLCHVISGDMLWRM